MFFGSASRRCKLRAGAGPAQRRTLEMGAGADSRLSQMDKSVPDEAALEADMEAAVAAAAAVKWDPAPASLASVADDSPTAASISASVASALIMQLGMPRVGATRRVAPQKGASAAPTAAKKAFAAGASTFLDVLAPRSTGGDDPGSGSAEGESSDQLAQMYVSCCPRCCLPACRLLSAGVCLPFMRSKRPCFAACQP